MICIIGSGLSAVAAAVALVRRGYRPTMLDAGLTLEPAALALKARMAATEPEAWHPEDVAGLTRIGPPAASGIPRKLHFGSEFPYRDLDLGTSPSLEHASMVRSFAFGGLSNVWGAVIQPFPDSELREWPVSPAELAPHYRAVRAALIDSCRPAAAPTVPTSSQGQALYRDLANRRRELERRGIRFDYPDLALRSMAEDPERGCRYCGLCLYGCPYDSIAGATSMLSRLRRDDRVDYVSGVLVERLSPTAGGVQIEARSLPSGAPQTFRARAVFVGAGVLESARIVLNSLGVHDTPLRLRHSDIFTLPILRYRSASAIARERLHTLCQLVVEIEDDAVCPRPVHLQLYGYNDLYTQLLARRMGWLAPPLAPAIRAAITRLFIAFGYLHSDVSSTLTLTLLRDSKLRVEGQANPAAWRSGRATVRTLLRNHRRFGAIPIPLALRFDLPGGGYHSGSSFPMSSSPGKLETDRWGRLHALPGVHLVDASILSSVPALPLAYTVMANAHRIGSECPLDNVQ